MFNFIKFLIMIYKKLQAHVPAPVIPPTDYVLESKNSIDERGRVRTSIEKVVNSEDVVREFLKDFRSTDFDIDVLQATGNTALLKGSPILAVSDLDAADACNSIVVESL